MPVRPLRHLSCKSGRVEDGRVADYVKFSNAACAEKVAKPEWLLIKWG